VQMRIGCQGPGAFSWRGRRHADTL
jgi:hypothetical protein